MRISAITNYNNYKNTINFSGDNKKPINEKYGIDIKTLPVINAAGIDITDKEKETLVKKILQAHELAQKNCNYGNITHRGYASSIGLENGMWHTATNFNNTRNDISSICGERTAIVGAYNDLLKSKPISNHDGKPLDFKIKYIAMSSHKPIGSDPLADNSCAECLSWYNTSRYFDDNTIVAFLTKDEETNNLALKLETVGHYLPLRCDSVEAPKKDVKDLPVKLTKKALKAVKEKDINETFIRTIVECTKDKYEKNNLADISGQNIAVGLLANNQLFFGAKTDFSRRWYINPLDVAASKAIELNKENTSIDAICYVGDTQITDNFGNNLNESVINLKTLGALRERFVTDDTLIISTKEDKIEIRTVDDFMPKDMRYIPKK